MKVKELRVGCQDGSSYKVIRCHAFRDAPAYALFQTGACDALVFVLRSSDISVVLQIRKMHPDLPLVLIADMQTDFGEKYENLCTMLSPAAMLRCPLDDVQYRRMLAAIYAAVPESISL